MERVSIKTSPNKLDRLKIEILNADGDVIRTLKGPAKPGINRTYWEMSRKGIRFNFSMFFGAQGNNNNDAEPAGASVLPGTYTARISYGDHTAETAINVKMDPRVNASMADLQARQDMYGEWESDASVFMKAADQIKDAKASIKAVNGRLDGMDDEAAGDLKKQGKALNEKLDSFSEMLAGKTVQGIRRDPNTVLSKLFTARGYISSGYDAPDESAHIALAQSREKLSAALVEINSFFGDDWEAYQQAVQDAEVSLFKSRETLELGN